MPFLFFASLVSIHFVTNRREIWQRGKTRELMERKSNKGMEKYHPQLQILPHNPIRWKGEMGQLSSCITFHFSFHLMDSPTGQRTWWDGKRLSTFYRVFSRMKVGHEARREKPSISWVGEVTWEPRGGDMPCPQCDERREEMKGHGKLSLPTSSPIHLFSIHPHLSLRSWVTDVGWR